MNYSFLLFVFLVLCFSNCGQELEVIQGHAHNDYEHENPLREALENGFISGSRPFNEVLNDEPKLA